MTRTLAHRGPDGEGIFINGRIGLGHRRLAIRGLGDAGNQPMPDASGELVVSYNGEIYNEKWLRAEVAARVGAQLKTNCDTELIAPAYRAWGEAFADKLEGMFAIALWDSAQESLILVRDPVGIKPLYIAQTDGAVYFASEIKALLAAPEVDRQFCPQGLIRFLAQGYPGPSRSTFRGIRPLPPGSMLVIDRDGVRETRYWRPRRQPDIMRMEDAEAEFGALWRVVVAEMRVSDVPIGVLCSGGIDSTLVSAELARSGPLPAFTAGFAGSAHDESQQAAIVARKLGLPHKVLNVSTESDHEAVFRRLVHHHDGQLGDSSALPFFLICQSAKAAVPVLFSGDGADEFFAGYETYRASRIAARLAPWVPSELAARASAWLRSRGGLSDEAVPRAEKLARFLAGIAEGRDRSHPQWRRHLFSDDKPGLYGEALAGLLGQDPLDEYAAAMDGPVALVDQCLQADQAYYLPGDLLMKSDSMSMAHSIELRVPFLDRRIMDLAGRIDASLLTPMLGPDKNLLRVLLARYGFGPEITTARKHGFNLPVANILREGLRDIGNRLLDRNADMLKPHLKPDGVRSMWRLHQENRANHSYILWNLLCLAVMKESL